MSFMSDDEQVGLRIDHLVLHVVGNDREFSPEPEMGDLENATFFIERIRQIASSSVHEFDEGSTTKALLLEMASEQRDFLSGGQELSRRFAKDHSGNSSDGAFFVVQLSSDDPEVRFYCLVKYDYSEAVELYEKDGRNALRQIVQAFVKERSAVQKFCLVRCKGGVVHSEVSASDRQGKAPDLTRYFSAFLDVKRNRDNAEMSQQLREAIRQTLSSCREHLPQRDVRLAERQVQDMLRNRDTVDDTALSEAVFVAAGRPEDEKVKTVLDRTLTRKLKSVNLDGVPFRPDQSIFHRPARRRIKTAENIVIEYPGEQDGQSVSRVQNPGGGWTISINTGEALVEDGTVPDKNR